MMNIVSFKAPKFKPLPGELTPAVINSATLPVKVESARRAIAACCDLSELLTWKDKLAALAAAAKIARMPELSRDVNRVHKEAIFRMGEILLQYNGTAVYLGCKGAAFSERREIANSVGIHPSAVKASVRLASSPKKIRERILSDDSIPTSYVRMSAFAPRLGKAPRVSYSEAAVVIFGGNHHRGLSSAHTAMSKIPLDRFAELAPEEKQRAKKLVVEMQEILDEMDRRLNLA
jgi:hypothetical protein